MGPPLIICSAMTRYCGLNQAKRYPSLSARGMMLSHSSDKALSLFAWRLIRSWY